MDFHKFSGILGPWRHPKDLLERVVGTLGDLPGTSWRHLGIELSGRDLRERFFVILRGLRGSTMTEGSDETQIFRELGNHRNPRELS